jgi:urease accessory protein
LAQNICEVQVVFNRFKSFKPVLLVCISLLLFATPASAHHPFGGVTPQNALQGFLSGLGHPVIGLDHLAFVIAIGLLAAQLGQVWLPVGFLAAALLGTTLHVQGVNLPLTEIVVAASVLTLGGLLAFKPALNPWAVMGLGAIAGLFHGYAYGEAIIGAGMSSLVAYMVGFTLIQLAIALAAYRVGQTLLNSLPEQPRLRFAGWAIAGMGFAFLGTRLLG